MFSKFVLHILPSGNNFFLCWYSLRISVTTCVWLEASSDLITMVRCLLSTPRSTVLETFQLRHSSVVCHTNQAVPDTSPSYPQPNFSSCSHFGVKITHSSCVGTRCQEWFRYLELPRKWDTLSVINRNGESVWKADFCYFLTVRIRGKCVFLCAHQGKAIRLPVTASHSKRCLLLLHNECWILNYCVFMLITAPRC